VTLNYRLAPQHTWPAGAEDVTRAVAWIREHAAEWGADPAQLFLWGHSSGSAHVADYLARTPNAPVKGTILMSGIFTPSATWSAYYGEDASRYAARAARPRLATLQMPMMIVSAELDPPEFITDTRELVAARRAAQLPTISLVLPNHSHLSEAYAVGTADESLTAPLLQFIKSPPR
jgi:triacylglycerol lipase